MTQLPLVGTQARAAAPATLADRARAWAERHDGGPFWALCEAMRAGLAEDAWPTVSEVDAAARGVLRWVEGGYQVGCPERAAEGERR